MTAHPAWCRSPIHAIRDRISFATASARFRTPAVHILDTMQAYPPEVQLDALFLTAVAAATSIGLDPHEMVVRARRILPDANGAFTHQLDVVGDYANGELKK